MPRRILLIDPPGWSEGINIGLAYLNAALKNRHFEVAILYPSIKHLREISFIDQVCRFKPDVVGISIKSSTLCNAQKIVSLLKESLPAGTMFMAGGPHITLLGDTVDHMNKVDLLVAGEAELSLPQILHSLDSQNTLPYSGSNVLMSKAINDLDSLEFPDFGGFCPGVDEQLKTAYGLLTSRGCPFHCSYCAVSLISGKKWRFRSPGNVIAELKRARTLYNTKEFYILDDNFTFDIERAKIICELLISSELKMEWTCPNGIRGDRIDQELACLMKRSGCRQVSLGIESADKDVLSMAKKGETLEEISRAIKILKDQDIHVQGFFIIGLPGDTLKRTLKALPFIERTGLDEALFNLFVPYPRTEANEWVQKHGVGLLDFHEGRHLLSEPRPVFETPEFTALERVKAYEMLHARAGKISFVLSPAASRVQRVFKTLQLLAKYDRRRLPKYIKTGIRNNWDRAGRFIGTILSLLNG